VFCGSSPGVDLEVARRSYDVGRGLAERGIGLVYGAGGYGLKREVSQGGLDAGGEVVGVIPVRFLNLGGLWTPLLDALHGLVDAGFIQPALTGLTGRLDAVIGDKLRG
jgi:predicted Rossmann-fold nucleotide-binding protein